MKCPLSAKYFQTRTDGLVTLMGDCLKEECAWWDIVRECCFAKTAVLALRDISFALKDIEHKLPSYERLV